MIIDHRHKNSYEHAPSVLDLASAKDLTFLTECEWIMIFEVDDRITWSRKFYVFSFYRGFQRVKLASRVYDMQQCTMFIFCSLQICAKFEPKFTLIRVQ